MCGRAVYLRVYIIGNWRSPDVMYNMKYKGIKQKAIYYYLQNVGPV